MKLKFYLIMLTFAGLFLLHGCGGGGTGGDTPKNTLHESQNCIDCHDKTALSPGTGQPIVTEWSASTHNTKNGASCIDCHGSGYMHPSSCSKCHSVGGAAVSPTLNPDMDAVCSKCHTKTFGYKVSSLNGITIDTAIAHFTNITTGTIRRITPGLYYTNLTSSYKITSAAGSTASWVASKYSPVKGDASKYGCRSCHNPHDTTSKIGFSKNWSRSGHGDTNSAARTGADFKTRGSLLPAQASMAQPCVRCHTTTGYINYVNSDFTSITALAPAGSPDHTKELTGCNVCHDDGAGHPYSFKLRNVLAANPGRSGVPAYYTYSTTRGGNARAAMSTNVKVNLDFPNASSSNMCVVCHMGREVGLSVKKAYLQGVRFNATGRISSHDFNAGANLFRKAALNSTPVPANIRSRPSCTMWQA